MRGRIFGQWVETLQAHGHEFLLTNSRSNEEGWEIIVNPDALPSHPVLRALARTPLWAWLLVAVTLLALAGWVLAATKHRAERRRRTFIPVDSDHKREARLHLLEDLELSGHGAIAPLRSLRRLLWLLDALQVGFGMNEGLRNRFGEILDRLPPGRPAPTAGDPGAGPGRGHPEPPRRHRPPRPCKASRPSWPGCPTRTSKFLLFRS